MSGSPAWKAAAAAAAVLIGLGLAAGGSYLLSLYAIHRTARNAATITQLCTSGNEFRAQQVVLWEHIIHISQPPPSETAAQRATRLAVTRQFDGYLHKVFAPRDC